MTVSVMEITFQKLHRITLENYYTIEDTEILIICNLWTQYILNFVVNKMKFWKKTWVYISKYAQKYLRNMGRAIKNISGVIKWPKNYQRLSCKGVGRVRRVKISHRHQGNFCVLLLLKRRRQYFSSLKETSPTKRRHWQWKYVFTIS